MWWLMLFMRMRASGAVGRSAMKAGVKRSFLDQREHREKTEL